MGKADFNRKQAEKPVAKAQKEKPKIEPKKEEVPELYTKIEESNQYKYPAGYEYLLTTIEKTKGFVPNDFSYVANHATPERTLTTMIGRSMRWCIQHGHPEWMPRLRSIRKRVDNNDRIDLEQFALLHTMKAVLLPYQRHPLTFRNCYMEPSALYEYNLEKLKFKYCGKW